MSARKTRRLEKKEKKKIELQEVVEKTEIGNWEKRQMKVVGGRRAEEEGASKKDAGTCVM